VVVTLRSDFEPRFLDSPLQAYWQAARFPVRAMNSDELRQAIEGPALKQALYFEPDNLVGMLIDEVGQMPGALPLLSFTLSELYVKLHERWTNNPESTDRALRIEDYEDLGGVAGALTRRATAEYESQELDDLERATMRRVMLRMVTIEGSGVARRQVPESELVYPTAEENQRREKVINQLVSVRLLVKGQDTGRTYVEPAHDFLLRWNKFQEWIEEEQEDLALQQRLTPAANDWKNSRGMLWTEEVGRLAKLEKILDSEKNWLNELETEFVRQSIRERQDRIKKLEEDLRISEQRRTKAELREKATRVENISSAQPLDGMTLAIQAVGQNLDELPQEILGTVQSSLLASLQISKETNILQVRASQDYAHSVAISHNGEYIVSGTGSGKVRLWDKYGNPINLPFAGHTPVNSEPRSEKVLVAISGSGEYIVSGSGDKQVCIWNKKGNFAKFFEVSQRVTGITISNDGRYIAVSSYDKKISVLDNSGNLLKDWIVKSGVTSISISSNGNYIVSGGQDGAVVLWNNNGELIYTFTNQQNEITSVAISTNSEYIISGDRNGTVVLWSRNGELIHCFTDQKQSESTSVAMSSDGRYIVAAKGNSYEVYLWDKKNNFNEKVFRSDDIFISSVAISSDGKTIAIASGDIKLWERNHYSTSISFEDNKVIIPKIAIVPNRQVVVGGGEDGTIGLWSFQGDCLYTFKGHEERINAVAVSPDGEVIITGGDDGIIKLWDENGSLLVQPITVERLRSDYGSYITSIAFSANGRLIVVGTEDGAIWKINRKGKIIGEPIIEEKGFVTSVAVSPIDKVIAISSSQNNTLRLADLAGNFIDKSFIGHTNGINSIAFSPNGKHIVSGSSDNTLRLWDRNGNQIGIPFIGHENNVISVAFSPNGNYIFSSSSDQTVRIWDLQGNPIGKPFTGHEGTVASIAISPDGKYIFSSSYSGQIKKWKAGSWLDWLQVACNRLRYHPIFKNPQTETEKAAYNTCQKYVWSNPNTKSAIDDENR
jgi:WD40 repeat protein